MEFYKFTCENMQNRLKLKLKQKKYLIMKSLNPVNWTKTLAPPTPSSLDALDWNFLLSAFDPRLNNSAMALIF